MTNLRGSNKKLDSIIDPTEQNMISISDELLVYTITGGVLGGIRHKLGTYQDFQPLGILIGTFVFGLACHFHTHIEVIVGFCLFNVEGSLLGLVAGSSIPAKIGAFLGFLSKKDYSYALLGAVIGASINESWKNHKNIEIYLQDNFIYKYKNITEANIEDGINLSTIGNTTELISND